MLLYISSLIIFAFVSFSMFYRLRCPLWVKIAGTCLILVASQKYALYRLLGGFFFAPHLPRGMLVVMEAMYGSLIVLFFLMLIWDLYLLGNWILARAGMPIPSSLPTRAIRCLLLVLAICLGCWGTWEAIKVPSARTVEVPVAGIARNLDGFRIAQLSDLHIGPILKKDWLAEVVARTNAEKPDLIALTGDYVDGYVEDLAGELAPLADLRAPCGVFGVTGNHEYYWNARQWTEVLGKLGVTMLENEHKVLDISGNSLVVAGVPDLVATRFGLPAPDPAKALAGAPEALKLFLAHQPKTAADNLPHGDIQLSGHTHGGLMFFLQPLIARFNDGLVSGLYPRGGKSVYVNPGTGLWNGFSCRIGVPAEITIIVLKVV